MRTPIALTVAGSDSGGGAGIQADLKTFSALGVYGCSVVTALTAQNTRGVHAVHTPPPAFVAAQLDAVLGDLAVAAVKVGMLGTAEVVAAVAEGLRRHRPRWVVLDPVMIAKGGQALLDAGAIDTLRRELLPQASLVTPNLPEAGALLGEPAITRRAGMAGVAARLQGRFGTDVLLKGGHLDDDEASPDLLLHGGEHYWLEAARTATPHTHGTGCSLSAGIAAYLARGRPLPVAVAVTKAWLAQAILAGRDLGIGGGRGPVHHFWQLWPDAGRAG